MQFPNLDTILQLNTSTQYYNVIVRLDSIWVDMELVTVAVYWYRRRRDGNITI